MRTTRDTGDSLWATYGTSPAAGLARFAELRPGEGPEALAHRVVRAERLVVARTSGRRRSPRRPRAPRPRVPRDASDPSAARRPSSPSRRSRGRRGRRAAGRARARSGCRRTCGTRGRGAATRRASRSPGSRPRSPGRSSRSARRPAGSRARRVSRRPSSELWLLSPGPPRDLRGGDDHQHREELPEHVFRQRFGDLRPSDRGPDRRDPDDERRPHPEVPVPLLAPDADERRSG